MQPNSRDSPDAEEREFVVVLQSAELALDRRAAAVQVAPLRGAALDRYPGWTRPLRGA